MELCPWKSVRGVGDSNSQGREQPSTVLSCVQYPHWEHSPKHS